MSKLAGTRFTKSIPQNKQLTKKAGNRKKLGSNNKNVPRKF